METQKMQFHSEKLEQLLQLIEQNTPVPRRGIRSLETKLEKAVTSVYSEINGNMLNYDRTLGWDYHQWVHEHFKELSFPMYIELCKIWIRSKDENLTPKESKLFACQLDDLRSQGFNLETILPKSLTTSTRFRYMQRTLYKLELYQSLVNELKSFVWEQLAFNTQTDIDLNPVDTGDNTEDSVHFFSACGVSEATVAEQGENIKPAVVEITPPLLKGS